jgi:hypothetical protein
MMCRVYLSKVNEVHKDTHYDTPAVVAVLLPRHGSRENNHYFGGLLRVLENEPERL